jgi:hypothetical protein
MRSSKPLDSQSVKVSDEKRLRELQYENDLLKLLYTDLLVKTAALKDGLATRRVRVC